MFKQHMLASLQFIRRLAKLVCNIQHRSIRPTILNARIAIPRHSKLQVKRSVPLHREPKVRRRDHIASRRGHLHLNCPTIQRQHQRSRPSSIGTLTRCHMQSARRTNTYRTTPFQFNLGHAISRRHRRISHQNRSSVTHLERPRDRSILHPDGPDRLLRLRYYRPNEEKRELTNLK